MPVFDVRKTGQQLTLPPEDLYAFEIKVVPGNAGPGGMLKATKGNLRQLLAALECTIIEDTNGKTEHARRKTWMYPIVDYDAAKYDDLDIPDPETGTKLAEQLNKVDAGRRKICAIVDSALGLMPDDESEEAESRREAALESWDKLNGLVFWAETKNKPAQNGYQPKMEIDWIVTPDDNTYPKKSKAVAVTSAPTTTKPALKDDMDDEIVL